MKKPVYLETYRTGELFRKRDRLIEVLSACRLCPRACEANRISGEVGHCQTGRQAIVSSFGPHFGEEPELVGKNGSGTIFFAHCNLNCVFCQNSDISQAGEGRQVRPEQLAEMMLSLQDMGCHNINLVSPTHVIAQVLDGLIFAIEGGLDLPIVYNSGGYDSVETLKVLEGVIDIYMPDTKYTDGAKGLKYSNAPDYPEINRAALKEMHRQVGDLVCDGEGVARRGLIIRHLVMPDRISGSFEILRFIAEELSRDSYVNIMSQYHPAYRAQSYPELNRRPSLREYMEVVTEARSLGLHRGF